MVIPILYQVRNLRRSLEDALQIVYRYQEQLEQYSLNTTSEQRKADVESVLESLNELADSFAKSKVLPHGVDIRVIFGLWVRLDMWHDALLGYKQDDYLVVVDDRNIFENPMCFLLQPLSPGETLIPHVLIPKEKYADFLADFLAGLSDFDS